ASHDATCPSVDRRSLHRGNRARRRGDREPRAQRRPRLRQGKPRALHGPVSLDQLLHRPRLGRLPLSAVPDAVVHLHHRLPDFAGLPGEVFAGRPAAAQAAPRPRREDPRALHRAEPRCQSRHQAGLRRHATGRHGVLLEPVSDLRARQREGRVRRAGAHQLFPAAVAGPAGPLRPAALLAPGRGHRGHRGHPGSLLPRRRQKPEPRARRDCDLRAGRGRASAGADRAAGPAAGAVGDRLRRLSRGDHALEHPVSAAGGGRLPHAAPDLRDGRQGRRQRMGAAPRHRARQVFALRLHPAHLPVTGAAPRSARFQPAGVRARDSVRARAGGDRPRRVVADLCPQPLRSRRSRLPGDLHLAKRSFVSPQIALLAAYGLIGWLLRRDVKRRTGVSHAVWIVAMWFAIFASRPFSSWFQGQQAQTAESYLEGSPLDAMMFFGLILAGAAVLVRRSVRFGPIVAANKWVFLFFGYCAISVVWSDYPFVAFKRWFKDFGNVVMVLVLLTEQAPIEAIKASFVRCASVLVPLSFAFIRYIPELGRTYTGWNRNDLMYVGVATHKNTLGALLLISCVFLYWDLTTRPAAPKKWAWLVDRADAMIVFLMAFWLLLIADSATSLLCTFLSIGLYTATALAPVKRRLGKVEVYAIVGGALWFTLDSTLGISEMIVGSLG